MLPLLSVERARAVRRLIDAGLAPGPGLPLVDLVRLATEADGRLRLDLESARRIGIPVLVVEPDPGSLAILTRLTGRERGVARLIADGRRNAEIGRALGLSLGTVKDHVHHILTKTGLRSRTELAARLTSPHWSRTTDGRAIHQEMDGTSGRRLATVSPMSARTPAKVSPLRGMDVTRWLETKADGWRLSLASELLRVAREAAPDARIFIKWGIPVLEDHGPVAFVKIAKAHVTFGFWRGSQLTDRQGLLEGGAAMKHWKLRSADAFAPPVLTAFVRQAVRLNRTLGDPTKRS